MVPILHSWLFSFSWLWNPSPSNQWPPAALHQHNRRFNSVVLLQLKPCARRGDDRSVWEWRSMEPQPRKSELLCFRYVVQNYVLLVENLLNKVCFCFKSIMLALLSSLFHTAQIPMAQILIVAVVACTGTLLLTCVITITIVGFVRFKKHVRPGKYVLLSPLWFTLQYSLPSTFCFCERLIQDALWRHQLQGNCHSLLIMLN